MADWEADFKDWISKMRRKYGPGVDMSPTDEQTAAELATNPHSMVARYRQAIAPDEAQAPLEPVEGQRGKKPREKPEADRWKRFFNPAMMPPGTMPGAAMAPKATPAPPPMGREENARSALLGWFRNPPGSQPLSPREQANRDNEQRYMQAMMALGDFGRGERARLAESDLFAQARVKQSLTNRGLGRSSVIGPMMAGIHERTNLGYMDLAEKMAARKIGLLQSKEATYDDSATEPLNKAAFNEGYARKYRGG